MGMRPHSKPGTHVISRGGRELDPGMDRLPRAFCARHGAEVHTAMRTDGAGLVREIVEPCALCLRDAKAAGAQLARGPRRCVCGRPIVYTGRGRPRIRCKECQP